MRIASSSADVALQILDILNRHGVTRGVSWEGGSPFDARMWIVVNAEIGPTVEAAIRRDIATIAGAAIQE